MSELPPVVVRPLRADETGALARCFERCYGDSYVDPTFHDPALLRERVEKGRLRSVVAVTSGGEIVGHMALTLRREGDSSVDAGNTVVDPAFRKQQLAAKLGLALGRLCRDEGFTAFHHYPTTAHPAMQKLAVRGGGVETGVMLDYIPATTRYREIDGAEGGPWSALVVYQPVAPAPERGAFLPERYAQLLAELFGRCGLRRSTAPADAPLEGGSESRLEVRSEPRRDLLRVHVERAGADLADRLDACTARHPSRILHVDLPLSEATGDAALEILRRRGFHLCALFPDYREGDVLRLQRLTHPGERRPEVVTDEGRALLARILEDRP